MEAFSKIGKIVLINLLVVVLLLALLEGGASLYFAYKDARQEISNEPFLAERLHTEYDPLLGWINKPNASIANMYGPNVYLKTNSQRFRNADDFATSVPSGRIRIICSGDSFTLGYGVDNDKTWCQLLESLDPRLQTVNMGQGGYGVGQSYLWYQRDGAKLDHNVHVFAFITDDFDRMRSTLLFGTPKPRLRLQNGQIAIENTPVTKLSFHRALKYARRVGLVRLAGEVSAFADSNFQEGEKPDLNESTKLVGAIFEQLKKIADSKNSTVVLVHLPQEFEYRDPVSDNFRSFLAHEAKKRNILFLNLITNFRKTPAQDVKRKFFQQDIKGFFGSKGHLTVDGNTYVAKEIYEALVGANILARP